MLGIGIPVSTFHHYMKDSDGERSIDFIQLLGSDRFRIFQETTQPAAQVVLQRLLQTAVEPGTRNFELECGVMELLAMSFRSFLTENHQRNADLSERDRDRLSQARDIMLERMIDPPSLNELARVIGVNEFLLKRGFKQLYGTTVFGYLRDQRLAKAYQLLQQDTLYVSETAYAGGYSNASYFSEALRTK